jgi:restriction system protein
MGEIEHRAAHLVLLAWPVWAGVGAIVALRLVAAIARWWRVRRSGIREIDVMPGEMFERRLELLFRRLGWRVDRTRAVGDFGADLILMSDDHVRTVVQAKRSARSVGVRAIQEVVAAKAHYACTDAMVVTNARFTAQAMQLAEANDVELWDRGELVRRLTARPPHSTPARTSVQTTGNNTRRVG